MKRLGLMVVAGLLCAILPVVQAADDASGFSTDTALSFDPGAVRFGYADGYWDNDHRWHAWPSAREAREFHRRFRDRIYGYRHTRYPHEGWRDGDNSQRRVSDPTTPGSPETRSEPHS